MRNTILISSQTQLFEEKPNGQSSTTNNDQNHNSRDRDALHFKVKRNQNESIVAESFLHCFRNRTWMFVSDMIATRWRSLWEGVLFFWKIDLIFNFVIFLCLKFSW